MISIPSPTPKSPRQSTAPNASLIGTSSALFGSGSAIAAGSTLSDSTGISPAPRPLPIATHAYGGSNEPDPNIRGVLCARPRPMPQRVCQGIRQHHRRRTRGLRRLRGRGSHPMSLHPEQHHPLARPRCRPGPHQSQATRGAQMRIMNVGPVEERAGLIIEALELDWVLHSGPNGTFLIDPENADYQIGIPRDVMEYLISKKLIDFFPAN